MGRYVDEVAWRAEVARPDWYLRIQDEYEELLTRARNSDRATAHAIATEIYGFFERVLAAGAIAVGGKGPDWDADRMPIDTAVIHHSKRPPGMTWQRLDAVHLIRIYARHYADPPQSDAALKGQRITSGHRRGAREIFVAYHWLVRRDGSCERLLNDDETGWHAGDWTTNCRSIGVCIDADLEHEAPSGTQLRALARLIRTRYPAIAPNRILGHCEINHQTSCPGKRFLGGWKDALVELARG